MRDLLTNFHGRRPLAAKAIQSAEKALGKRLPSDYIEFLKIANGGEGFVGDASYVILWGVHELARRIADYEVEDYVSGFLLFGSDGGGEAFGFDTRKDPWCVVRIPFIPMQWKLARKMGASFHEFLRRLHRAKV